MNMYRILPQGRCMAFNLNWVPSPQSTNPTNPSAITNCALGCRPWAGTAPPHPRIATRRADMLFELDVRLLRGIELPLNLFHENKVDRLIQGGNQIEHRVQTRNFKKALHTGLQGPSDDE